MGWVVDPSPDSVDEATLESAPIDSLLPRVFKLRGGEPGAVSAPIESFELDWRGNPVRIPTFHDVDPPLPPPKRRERSEQMDWWLEVLERPRTCYQGHCDVPATRLACHSSPTIKGSTYVEAYCEYHGRNWLQTYLRNAGRESPEPVYEDENALAKALGLVGGELYTRGVKIQRLAPERREPCYACHYPAVWLGWYWYNQDVRARWLCENCRAPFEEMLGGQVERVSGEF